MGRGWKALNKAVAVSGAGSGIGRALCRKLAAAGARSVLALDVNLEHAQHTIDICEETAPECVGHAQYCDASDHSSLRAALLAQPLDLFCANAGVATAGDCSATDAAWQRTWQLNVMQLKWAADILVPSMTSRPEGGALLVTASAAGLLSQLGSAPYTTTKHAVVGLAEWLAITHSEAGLTVCCVCPQGVRTPMVEDLLGVDSEMRSLAVDGLMEADDVAAEALQSLEEGRFLCMPGGEARGAAKYVTRKAADRERWIAGMSRLQSNLAK